MYYYLYSIQNDIYKLAKGTAQLGINQDTFYNIKIPIPSLEDQKEIVSASMPNNLLSSLVERRRA